MKTQYKKEGIYKLSKLFFVVIVLFVKGMVLPRLIKMILMVLLYVMTLLTKLLRVLTVTSSKSGP